MENLKKWSVLAATIVFWGLAFTAIKYSIRYLNPFELASLRFAIADIFFFAGIVGGLFLSKRSGERTKNETVNIRDIPSFFILGFFGVTVYHVCLNTGEITVNSGIASLIISTAPIFVLIFSRLFLKERITGLKIAGVVIAFTGVAVLSNPEKGNIEGILLIFASSISAAIYTVLGKSLMHSYKPVTLTNYAMLLGSIPLLVFLPNALMKTFNAGSHLIWSVIFLGVFSTYLGYQGWYYFLEKEEASRASVFLLAIPFVSVIAGAVLLGESVMPLTAVGGLAIVVGIFLVLRG